MSKRDAPEEPEAASKRSCRAAKMKVCCLGGEGAERECADY